MQSTFGMNASIIDKAPHVNEGRALLLVGLVHHGDERDHDEGWRRA